MAVVEIPQHPEEFFTQFFPAQYEVFKDRYPKGATDGSAAFEVNGVGAWSIRLVDGKLDVSAGVLPDNVIHIGVSAKDFDELFVRRTRRELKENGDFTNATKDAFRPLFATPKRKAIAMRSQGTLVLRIDQDGEKRDLAITVGGIKPVSPPRTIVNLPLDTFFDLLATGDSTRLYLTGRLTMEGDAAYALMVGNILK